MEVLAFARLSFIRSSVLDTDEERELKRPRQQETPASQSQPTARRTKQYRRQRPREGERQELIEIITSEDEGVS